MATLKRKRKAATHHVGWDIYKLTEYNTRGTGKTRWRWRYVARNMRITKASSESFTTRRRCVDNARASGYTG